jgi:hypothetical protein
VLVRNRQLEFLLPSFTPRTVFMAIGSRDGELSVRAAGYVERVWCVNPAVRPARAPCNVRCDVMGGVPIASIDVAFSERPEHAADVRRLLRPGGVWFIYGSALPAPVLTAAGFARVQYYAGKLRVPRAVARASAHPITAAYT